MSAPTETTVATATASTSISNSGNALIKSFSGTNGILLCVALAGFLVLSWLGQGHSRRGRLATARFAGTAEKAKARRKAQKQMKAKRHNQVAVDIYKSVYLPDLQQGLIACGGAGSGKTESMLLPAMYSSIEQGYPMLVYDFKYGDPRDSLTGSIAAYAVKHGYKVHIFAPGFPESEICNPLDFLIDDLDGEMAGQLARVMNRNLKPAGGKGDDPFFSIAGDLLILAVLLLAKQTAYPDMVQCQKILSLTKLKDRIEASDLSYLTKSTFDQFLSVAASEKTADSIRGTAQNLFVPFTTPGISSAFCGETTLPLTITGKTLVVLGLNKANKESLAPYVAGILQMLVQRNLSFARTDPFVLAIDELPTIFTDIDNWLAQNRSAGLCCLLGVQDYGQLEDRYGKERARTIFANAATKAIFAQQEYESARSFSDLLGDQEIHYKQKSRGSSGGKASTNVTDTERTGKLFTPDQFSKLPPGKCVLVSPGFSTKSETKIPILQQIPLTEKAKQRKAWCQKMWNEKVLPRLIARSTQPQFANRAELRDYTETLLKSRHEEAAGLLPEPPQSAQQPNGKVKFQF